MTQPAQPIPEHRDGAIPYLSIRNAAEALDFYKKAFGAHELLRLEHGGKIDHAEMNVGGATVMLSEEFPEYDALSPQSVGGTPVVIHLYVTDVDAFTEKAIAAGTQSAAPCR